MANYRTVLAAVGGLATTLLGTEALAAPTVWAIDDGEKIKQDAIDLPFEKGTDNPVWSPGQPIRLVSMKNETVAFQVVVEADDTRLDDVTVDLDKLEGPGGATIANAPGATDPTKFVGRPIERFVEHFFEIKRASGSKDSRESLGWYPGSGPEKGDWTGMVPDALIPVEVAPSWSPYPMRINARKNGIVWIDITVPASQPPGMYKGNVVVKAGNNHLATLPVELQIVDVTLPDLPVKTMVFYSRGELDRRIGGGDAAEKHLWQLYHRHRLSAMHSARKTSDVHLSALDGTVFRPEEGYEGPGQGKGDGILSLGTYGGFGAPDTSKLATVESIAELVDKKGLFATTDVFVYAIDEDCSSPYGATWKSLLAGSDEAAAKKVKVGWTCSQDPSTQPVDIPIILARYDPVKVAAAKAKGKDVWLYNGMRPWTGAFLTDTPATDTRVNGWISGIYDVGRWFYWESTFWYDDNRGGHGEYDPFVTAETFHNQHGDYCQGDGVLVYPGKQVDSFTEHSIGMNGVIASIRLKNWRRGIEDAGYYQLARAANPAKAEAIAKGLLPKVVSAATSGKPPSWSERGKPFFDARMALLQLIPHGTGGGGGGGGDGDDAGSPGGGDGPSADGGGGGSNVSPSASDAAAGCGCRSGCTRCSTAAAPFVLAGCLMFFRRRRRMGR